MLLVRSVDYDRQEAMSLTDNWQRFVAEYLVDLNATQAAIRAGHSERPQGSLEISCCRLHGRRFRRLASIRRQALTFSDQPCEVRHAPGESSSLARSITMAENTPPVVRITPITNLRLAFSKTFFLRAA